MQETDQPNGSLFSKCSGKVFSGQIDKLSGNHAQFAQSTLKCPFPRVKQDRSEAAMLI
jgi:hypothetical protein